MYRRNQESQIMMCVNQGLKDTLWYATPYNDTAPVSKKICRFFIPVFNQDGMTKISRLGPGRLGLTL